MPSLQPVVTFTNHAKQAEYKPPAQSFENIRSVISPPKSIPEPTKEVEIEHITIPKNTKIFGANFARELRKNEKKKEKKEIEYLPGEKLVIELQKSLKKDKKRKEDKEHISTLTKSINNIIEDLEI